MKSTPRLSERKIYHAVRLPEAILAFKHSCLQFARFYVILASIMRLAQFMFCLPSNKVLAQSLCSARNPRTLIRRGISAAQSLVLGGACATTLGICTLYFGQSRLIWIGQRRNNPGIAGVAAGELIRVNPTSVCCFMKSPHAATTIVYFHGNGDQIGWGGVYLGQLFSERGYSFCAVEYPGYGLAGGETSEASVLGAAEAVLLHLEESKGIDRKSMVLFGQSIGWCVLHDF